MLCQRSDRWVRRHPCVRLPQVPKFCAFFFAPSTTYVRKQPSLQLGTYLADQGCMLRRLIAQGDISQFSAFLTPALLDVVSIREVVSRGRQVRMSTRDARYSDAIELRRQALWALPLQVTLGGQGQPIQEDGLGMDPGADAARIVTLFFHQLFSDSPTLLDLRSTAFSPEEIAPKTCSQSC